jgi:hypothetical protein
MHVGGLGFNMLRWGVLARSNEPNHSKAMTALELQITHLLLHMGSIINGKYSSKRWSSKVYVAECGIS